MRLSFPFYMFNLHLIQNISMLFILNYPVHKGQLCYKSEVKSYCTPVIKEWFQLYHMVPPTEQDGLIYALSEIAVSEVKLNHELHNG